MKSSLLNLKKYLPFFLIIVLSFFAIKPLTIAGFFPIHDNTQVARVFEMTKSLKDGMFPVRWVMDLGYGYGYPIFNFYAPFSYYAGSFFNLLGFDSLVSLKIMMGIGILLSGVSMYFLARQFWGESGAFVSALLYVYAPYHALDIYVRGDVAELWAYAFIPLVFYSLHQIYKTRKFRYIFLGSISYSGIILSHNLTALMISPFVLVISLLYSVIAYRNKKIFIIYCLLFAVFVGLLLATFYWLPALLEINYTNVFSQVGGGADFRNHFVCIEQLWDSPWGYGGSVPGCVDGISFKIGKLALILSGVSFFMLLFNLKHLSEKSAALIFSVGGLLISIFLLLPYSRFIWETITPMSFFQYPWRFLILCSFFSSFASGYFIITLFQMLKIFPFQKTIYLITLGFVTVFLIQIQGKSFVPQYIAPYSISDYISEKALRWTTSKISDEYMPQNFRKPKNENEVVNPNVWLEGGGISTVSQQEKTQDKEALVTNSKPAFALIHVGYFPAWKIYIDKKETHYSILDKGIQVKLSKGTHLLMLRFEQTLIEKLANSISVIGIFLLIIGIIKKRKNLGL